ncbi:hypothetical protein L2734_05765 [Parashewanella spongiae]|nr:hypothetical protein [Parashewanella spongiae]MCL1077685.1 hypothetical protein [Parashewanella spongiae]
MFSFIGLSWSLYGLLLGNPGALPLLSVMAVYPLLFCFFSFLYQHEMEGRSVIRFFKICSWSLVFVQLAFLTSFFGLDGQFFYHLILNVYSDLAVIDSGSTHLIFTLPNVGSLLFLLPFFFCYYMLNDNASYIDLTLLLLMFIIVILSGRRAFFVSVFLSVLFIIPPMMFFKLYSKKLSRKIFYLSSLIIIAIILVLSFTEFSMVSVVENIKTITDFETNADNYERLMQFFSLYNGYADYPIFGLGAGAVGEYIRSPEQPWAYELFYLSFLFQYGTFGSIFYLFGVCYITLSLLHKLKLKHVYINEKIVILCIVSGFLSFLIANGSNPYLAKFDYMWVIFFPLYFNIYINNLYKFRNSGVSK